MGADAMIRVLKDRRISVHGAHVYLLGMPAIMSLASAYATDKITRKVLFDTLDTFVRHIERIYPTHPKAIKHHHLVSLGIPEAVIRKFPMRGASLDIWTVAGLFNGVIDAEDMDLLYSSGEKGVFQQRHFPGTATVPAPDPFKFEPGWGEEQLVMAPGIWALSRFNELVPPLCALLEKRVEYYDPIVHYGLRLTAARRKGEQLSVFECEDLNQMKTVFNDVFHVVDPNYQPGDNSRQEWDNFHFVEPPIWDGKPATASSSRRNCAFPCNVA